MGARRWAAAKMEERMTLICAAKRPASIASVVLAAGMKNSTTDIQQAAGETTYSPATAYGRHLKRESAHVAAQEVLQPVQAALRMHRPAAAAKAAIRVAMAAVPLTPTPNLLVLI